MTEEINIQVFEQVNKIIANSNGVFIEIAHKPVNVTAGRPAHLVKVVQEGVTVVVNSILTAYGSAAEISHIELDLLLAPNSISRHKVPTYTGDQITVQKVYTDNTLAVQLYEMTYNYLGENLENIVVERLSDNFIYTKTFTYDIGGKLISINYN